MARIERPAADHSASIWRRIAVGIGELAWYGAACALLATLVYAAEGRDIVREGGLPLLPLIGVYSVITVVCGALLGLLKPIAKGAIGMGLVATIVALPAIIAVMWFSADRRFERIGAVDYAIAVVLAAIVGPLSVAYARIRRTDWASRR
jgi:hypothetical protein